MESAVHCIYPLIVDHFWHIKSPHKICLVLRPHYVTVGNPFRSHGPGLLWIHVCHQNQMTAKAWEKAKQELGKYKITVHEHVTDYSFIRSQWQKQPFSTMLLALFLCWLLVKIIMLRNDRLWSWSIETWYVKTSRLSNYLRIS